MANFAGGTVNHLHKFGNPANFGIIGRNGHQICLCERGQGHPGTWLAGEGEFE